MGMSNSTYLSVITVVLDDEVGIRKTINSLKPHITPQIEHIIVDGKSKDRTLDIIHSLNTYNAKVVSKKDTGIYDAMNRGVAMAKGEFIIFMNSGDEFYSEIKISKILSFLSQNKNTIVYGNCFIKKNEVLRLRRYSQKLNFDFGLPFNHQSCFTPRELFRENSFDTDLKILSDLKLYKKLMKNGVKFNHLDTPIAVYDLNGISSRYSSRYLRELKIINTNFKGLKWNLFVLKYKVKWILKI